MAKKANPFCSIEALRSFNLLNSNFKEGVTLLQTSTTGREKLYFRECLKSARKIKGVFDGYDEYIDNMVEKIKDFMDIGDAESIISNKSQDNAHHWLWKLHKKVCEECDVLYTEDVEEMNDYLDSLEESGELN
jgi:hypothetical protein